jgi:predicted restriction endonuclease
VANAAYLIASHIKPWSKSSNQERLDGRNGLLLAPHIDHLFDNGFISFADDGRLLISPAADKGALRQMGVPADESFNAGAFDQEQRKYLAYHRDEVFKKSVLGTS